MKSPVKRPLPQGWARNNAEEDTQKGSGGSILPPDPLWLNPLYSTSEYAAEYSGTAEYSDTAEYSGTAYGSSAFFRA
jgi:hypothetical protein